MRNVYRNTLLDLPVIHEFISQWDDDLTRLRDILVDTNSYILSDLSQGDIYVILEGRGKQIAHLHVYITNERRGLDAVKFIGEVGKWVKKHTDLKYVFNYTKDRKVMMFMKSFGVSKRVGTYKGYTVYRSEVL